MTGRKVAGLAGLKGSGKSTAAAGMPAGWKEIGLADPLKTMLIGANILTRDEAYGRYKERPIDWLGGSVTPRRLMQDLGTGWGRSIHPDFWVLLWMHEAGTALDFGAGVVVPDVRFPNEIDAVRRLGGKVAWIERPGLAADDGHISENAIGPGDCDLVVVNDGDEWALRHRVWSELAP